MRMLDARRVIKEIKKSGEITAGWEMDLTNTKRIPILFDVVEGTFGRVDILINNSVHYDQATDTLLEISESAIDDTFTA